ncbi:hypothetical protein L6V77_25845, partial [Myxococcota bacterium]|nr:hypothetical protein [Myxococcota bacterium]
VIQRYVDWIEHDCVKHWQNQVRVGWEKIAEARADLAAVPSPPPAYTRALAACRLPMLGQTCAPGALP